MKVRVHKCLSGLYDSCRKLMQKLFISSLFPSSSPSYDVARKHGTLTGKQEIMVWEVMICLMNHPGTVTIY